MSGQWNGYGDMLFAAVMVWLALISLVSVLVTIIDKHRAARGKGRRIPENTLMLLGALGGAAAMLIAMLMICHKTRHIKFMLGLPILLLFQAVIALYAAVRLI